MLSIFIHVFFKYNIHIRILTFYVVVLIIIVVYRENSEHIHKISLILSEKSLIE